MITLAVKSSLSLVNLSSFFDHPLDQPFINLDQPRASFHQPLYQRRFIVIITILDNIHHIPRSTHPAAHLGSTMITVLNPPSDHLMSIHSSAPRCVDDPYSCVYCIIYSCDGGKVDVTLNICIYIYMGHDEHQFIFRFK
jgi:hypothetical protein